jgi:hypothetical protein
MKTIEHIWTVICQSAIIDQQTNILSLQNVLEEAIVDKKDNEGKSIIPEKGEAIPLTFQVVSLWKKLAPLDQEVVVNGELEVTDPTGATLLKNPLSFKIEKNTERSRSLIGFQGFKITAPGEYTFILRAKEGSRLQEVSRTYLAIKFVV